MITKIVVFDRNYCSVFRFIISLIVLRINVSTLIMKRLFNFDDKFE